MEINKQDIEKEREIIKELQKQLAEKEKEIKELKEKEYWAENGLKLRDIFIRHQVCDEIREKAEIFGAGPIGKIGYLIKDELLDKIEQAKESSK